MNNLVIITGYKDMSFKDSDGENIDMLKLTCLTQNGGKDSVGFLPIQQTYMNENKTTILRSLKDVPGVYSAKYDMVPGKNNKPTLELVGFDFIKPLDLKSVFEK